MYSSFLLSGVGISHPRFTVKKMRFKITRLKLPAVSGRKCEQSRAEEFFFFGAWRSTCAWNTPSSGASNPGSLGSIWKQHLCCGRHHCPGALAAGDAASAGSTPGPDEGVGERGRAQGHREQRCRTGWSRAAAGACWGLPSYMVTFRVELKCGVSEEGGRVRNASLLPHDPICAQAQDRSRDPGAA